MSSAKKLSFIIFFVLLFSFLSIMCCCYPIEPWKTIHFSTLTAKEQIDFSKTEQFKYYSEKYPEYLKNNTFIYVCSHASDETVFSGKEPYKFTFRFWTFDDNKQLKIKTIKVLNEDLNFEDNNINFETIIKKRQVTNSNNTDVHLSKYSLEVYSTPYIFNLQDYKKDIKIQMSFSLDEEDFNLTFTLKRFERKKMYKWS